MKLVYWLCNCKASSTVLTRSIGGPTNISLPRLGCILAYWHNNLSNRVSEYPVSKLSLVQYITDNLTREPKLSIFSSALSKVNTRTSVARHG